MTITRWAWVAYFVSLALSLLWKWYRYVRTGWSIGKTTRQSSGEWFFEKSLENGASWVTTIAACWAVGGIYIDKIVAIPGLSTLPVHPSIAALLASVTEFTAPNIVKWLLSKLPTE